MPRRCCEEICCGNFYISCLLEGLCVALLVFIGGTIFIRVDFQTIGHVCNDHVTETAVVFGVTLAGLSFCLKDISGSHMNPAITIAALLTRRVSLLRAICYVIFQCGGGILGAFALRELIPGSSERHLAMTTISADFSLSKAVGMEMIFTFVYTWLHFASKGSYEVFKGYGGPLAVGFFYGVSHIVIIKYTGCSLNPARSLGPAVLKESFEDHWVYWAGPVLAACFAGLLNDIVFRKARHPVHPRPRSCSLTCCKPSREEATLAEYSRYEEPAFYKDYIIKKPEEDA